MLWILGNLSLEQGIRMEQKAGQESSDFCSRRIFIFDHEDSNMDRKNKGKRA